jgi:hypothetical protein
MVAYTDAAKIAAYLGVTLTSGQQTQAGITAQALRLLGGRAIVIA